MPYTTVVAGTVITASWANANVRDQVVTPFADATARDSAITSPVSGMTCHLADPGCICVYDGSAWQVASYVPAALSARKTAPQSITSSTTLENDDHLFFDVLANAVYEVRAYLLVTAATAGDLKVGWSGPSGATFDWNIGSLSSGATDNTSTTYWGSNDISGTDVAGGTSIEALIRPAGLLVTSSTAGAFTLRWAQGSSSGTATTLATNSFMVAERIG